MRKQFIIGGLVFWASVSGYMGLRVLESYTEDAVYAVLSVVPAQAQEIRYNFLTDDLRVTGIEYEIPHDTVVHRGTIESVEISKFHRKIMYVKPHMPPYDADELPRVGENFKIRGIVDRIHEGHSVLETKIGEVDMVNWYQRVGMVLDHFARKGVGEAFFEELLRTRVDELSASDVQMTLNDPSMKATLSLRADRITLPGGIPAPRGLDRTTPVNVVLERVSFAQGEASASAGRIDGLGLRMPEPDKLARIAEFSRAVREGKNEALSEELMLTLDTCWDKYAPFGSAALQNVIVKPGKDAETMKSPSVSCAMKREGDAWKLNAKGFEAESGLGELFEDAVKLFVPKGLNL